MHIAIIGPGAVGSALARGWAAAGHSLHLGARRITEETAALAATTGAALHAPEAAAAAAGVVALTLPWAAAPAALAGLGDLSGKIVIDCMNPLGRQDGAFGLLIGHTSSGAEAVAGWLPGARVVKTLNQVGAEIMADNARMAHRPAMFMAGDDPAAKATVATLLADLGFDPLDAGDLQKARLLEPLALVWINQALMRGKGRHWALAALPNPATPETAP